MVPDCGRSQPEARYGSGRPRRCGCAPARLLTRRPQRVPLWLQKMPPISGRSPEGRKPLESQTSTPAIGFPAESTTTPSSGSACKGTGAAIGWKSKKQSRGAKITAHLLRVSNVDRAAQPETIVRAHPSACRNSGQGNARRPIVALAFPSPGSTVIVAPPGSGPAPADTPGSVLSPADAASRSRACAIGPGEGGIATICAHASISVRGNDFAAPDRAKGPPGLVVDGALDRRARCRRRKPR